MVVQGSCSQDGAPVTVLSSIEASSRVPNRRPPAEAVSDFVTDVDVGLPGEVSMLIGF